MEPEITILKVISAPHFEQRGFSLGHKEVSVPFTNHNTAVTRLFLNREVKADDLKAAFCSIDPNIDGQTLDTYVGLASQAGREEPDREAVPVGTVLERLLTGDVRRVGPSPVEGSTAGFEGE